MVKARLTTPVRTLSRSTFLCHASSLFVACFASAFFSAGAAAGGHDNGAGVLAGDWALHNAAISYAAIAGRNDVLLVEDNGALTDLWQSFQ